MEMYGKATRWMYVKLWMVECDWKCWRKGSLCSYTSYDEMVVIYSFIIKKK